MEKTKSKAIVYDDSCPLCSLYTQGFVRWGLLEPQNRIPFSRLNECGTLENLDLDKARHYIPLVDLTGSETLYGPDALVFLLQQKIPVLGKLMQLRMLQKLVLGLYHVISYNRRVIIPAQAAPNSFDCAPDYNPRYRLAFIFISLLIASLGTFAFEQSLKTVFPVTAGGWAMLLIAGTGWLLQIALALLFLRQNKIDYIGQLCVIMLVGVLLLMPGVCITAIWPAPVIPLISVLLSSCMMLQQHLYRVKYLQISSRWTFLWFFNLQSTAAIWSYLLFLK